MSKNKTNKTKLAWAPPVPIQMYDHESMPNEQENGQGRSALDDDSIHGSSAGTGSTTTTTPKPWCKNVMIGEYTIVTGTNLQRFVVWTITLETAINNKIEIRKRFTDFVHLREYLIKKYPSHSMEIPKLPPKSVFQNFDNNFLEKRRNGLEFFISSVLLNPIFSDDATIKAFVTNK